MDEAEHFMVGVKRIEAEVQRRQKLLGDHLRKRNLLTAQMERLLPHARLIIKVKEHRDFVVPEAMLQELKTLIQAQSTLLSELVALREKMTTAFVDIDGLSEHHLQMGDLVLQQISEAFEKTILDHQRELDELFDLYNALNKL